MNKTKEGMLLAFGEMFLKSSGVFNLLKRKLVNNLRHFLKKEDVKFKIFSGHERIFIETTDFDQTAKILQNTFGIVWFAKTFLLKKADLGHLEKFIHQNYQDWIKKEESFALRVKGNKEKSREEIIDRIARGIKREVNLDNPDKKIFIEQRKRGWFVYFEKQRGLGGLPAGSQGKCLCLISGGIDSPAAAWLMAKRGVENIWLHFHSFPLVSKASIEKVKKLAKVFLNYQPKLEVCFIPFAEIQTEIKLNTPPKYRVLLYRRMMFKIAEKLRKQKKCFALVTGESLGQVSSQTLPNIQITSNAAGGPVLRPLIGMDKEEIISLAKKIGTFNISIQPQEDCCTLFVPKHQTAEGTIEIVKNLEQKIKPEKLITKTIKQVEVKNF